MIIHFCIDDILMKVDKETVCSPRMDAGIERIKSNQAPQGGGCMSWRNREQSCQFFVGCGIPDSTCSIYCRKYRQIDVKSVSKTEVTDTFHIKLFKIAEEQDLDDHDIARMSGLPLLKVRNIKRKKGIEPSDEIIEILSKVFKIDRSYFLED